MFDKAHFYCYILAEDAGGDCKCICLKRTDFRVYIFSRILVDFAKSNTRETFFLNSICEKIYTPNKHNINISWKKIHERKYAQKMFVNSAFFRINQQQQFIHRDLPVFPLILTETLAITLVLFTLTHVFFSHSVHLQKFINSKFSKLTIRKNK